MKEQIQDYIERNKLDLSEYSDSHDLYSAIDYDGTMHEIIDGQIDIYYYSLRQWAVDNYDYIEQAVDEGLVDTTEFDYHKAIQAGQYCYYSEQAKEIVEQIFEEAI